MFQKNKLTQIACFLILSALVIVLTQFWSIPLKHILVGIATGIMLGVLIIIYLLRFALVFLGVFAAYKAIRDLYEKRSSERSVQLGVSPEVI